MKKSEAFPGKNFKGVDLDGHELTLTMSHVDKEEVGEEKEIKNVLHFIGEPKGLVLNGINWDTIAACYGDESDNWAGKRIKLWYDPTVKYGPKVTGGIRIRTPQAPRSAPPPRPATAPPPPTHEDYGPDADDSDAPF